jgi:uncharacterized membrane protein
MLLGTVKTMWPVAANVAGVAIPATLMVMQGLLETLLGIGILVRRTRMVAVAISAVVLVLSLIVAVAFPALNCGCLGRIKLAQGQRLLLIGVLLATTGIAMYARKPEGNRSDR